MTITLIHLVSINSNCVLSGCEVSFSYHFQSVKGNEIAELTVTYLNFSNSQGIGESGTCCESITKIGCPVRVGTCDTYFMTKIYK